MNRLTSLLIFSLTIVAAAPAAEAADGSEAWRKDRFYLGLGFYRPNMDTRIRINDANTGISGTLLNLEDDLDLNDRKSQITLDAHFRFAKRHAVEFEYVKLKRTDESNVGFVIDYDGRVIDISEDVETTFNTEVYRLAYRFSFINSEKMELSAAVGLHVTDLKIGLNVVGEEADFNDVTAPLPTLGGAWKYHFNDQWTFHIRGEWLDIKIDNVNGKLTSGLAEVSWFPAKHFGVSLGYNIWDLSVTATRNDLTGRVEYKYDGPKLTLKTRF
jgi:hypothetical protein